MTPSSHVMESPTNPGRFRTRNEDDNAEWDSWFADNLPIIRSLDIPFLFLAHERKSGGKDGSGLRGATAILGAVDIAASVRRVDGNPAQRLLRMEGTRVEPAKDALLEINEEGEYVMLGDAWQAGVVADIENQRIMDVMRDGRPRTIREIHASIEGSISETTIRRRVKTKLIPAGFLVVVSRDPYTIKKPDLRLSAPYGGAESGC